MRQATSRSGVLVVLKKTIVDCPLLHYFSGIKAPSNHTIPLLDVIDLSIENVVSLCLRFIEGVDFCISTTLRTVTSNPGT